MTASRVVADVWEKDVWDFQAKSGNSSCSSFFNAKSQFKKCLGEHLEVPDILLPDIRGLLSQRRDRIQRLKVFFFCPEFQKCVESTLWQKHPLVTLDQLGVIPENHTKESVTQRAQRVNK